MAPTNGAPRASWSSAAGSPASPPPSGSPAGGCRSPSSKRRRAWAAPSRRSRMVGWRFEMGPNTVARERRERDGRLIRDAGLDGREDRRCPVGEDGGISRRAAGCSPLPGGPGGLLKTPLFSAGAKLRLLREPWIGRPPGEETRRASRHSSAAVSAPSSSTTPSARSSQASTPAIPSGCRCAGPCRRSMRWRLSTAA